MMDISKFSGGNETGLGVNEYTCRHPSDPTGAQLLGAMQQTLSLTRAHPKVMSMTIVMTRTKGRACGMPAVWLSLFVCSFQSSSADRRHCSIAFPTYGYIQCALGPSARTSSPTKRPQPTQDTARLLSCVPGAACLWDSLCLQD